MHRFLLVLLLLALTGIADTHAQTNPPPPDLATVPVPPGQPPIPAVPTAPTPTVPPVVTPPPAVPPVAPAPATPATVLTNIQNSVVLSQAVPLGPGVLNDIVDTFVGQASLWEATLENIALSLFAALALIELAWVFGWAMARGGHSIQDWMALAAQQIVVIGFFYWLLLNSADFILAIVASFGQAANDASVAGGGMTNLSPSDLFTSGLNMVKVIWDGMTITSPGLSTLLVLAGLIMMYVYAVIAAKLIEVLVEAAFVAYAGIIMMGFGGTSFTREYAIAQFRYAISVGVKRFVLQLIVGLAQGIITSWASTVANSGALNWTTIGIMVGAPIVMLRLVETLPQRAQDMVMGVSTHAPGSMAGTAARAGAAAGAAIAGLAGAGVATQAAFKLAQQQIEERGSQGKSTGGNAVGRAAMTVGMMARNMGSAAAHDVGQRMVGHNRFGHPSWRMAEHMGGEHSASAKRTEKNQSKGGQQ
jgi:type IV secretion system protein TrbL